MRWACSSAPSVSRTTSPSSVRNLRIWMKSQLEKPTFIPYYVSDCKNLPGKCLLGYQLHGKPRVEFVTITHDGFRYRSQISSTVNGLFRWLQDHYQEPVPGITPSNSSRTRTPASVNATPANINIAVSALPQYMTSQMFNTIAVVTGQGQNHNSTPAVGVRPARLQQRCLPCFRHSSPATSHHAPDDQVTRTQPPARSRP
ncbi:hypothetical protein AAFF_G00183380 [Aldrovandia affinis]|uniref:Spt6 SH2 domain-containing protein n=1 Tax=Aldrovandia affinis TaxID=143900 RepID=A0AAD7W704_9TELE|nr:hypothetical protein AAFF_G00183380 [Aldrovandia affinis]